MPLEVYTGPGKDGGTVTVLAGDPVDEVVAQAAAAFTGAPLGAPRPGAILTRVGAVSLAATVRRAASVDRALPPPPPSPAAPPVATKRVQLTNAALVRQICARLSVKAAEPTERGLATGIVMEPDVTDTQGQIASAADVEAAMIYWACNGGAVDLMHSFEAIVDERVDVVEFWICRAAFKLGEKDVTPGTWLMTTKWQVDGRYWAAIKDGTFNAYSIGGLGTTEPIDD